MLKWYQKDIQENDVAVSSEIKISRNVKGYPFPNKMTAEQQAAVNETVKTALIESGMVTELCLQQIDMSHLSDMQAASLAERGVISKQFIFNRANKILFLSKDESIRIALCDEDHITVTVTDLGICFGKLKRLIDKIDSVICSDLPIAFDEHLGFLTACPSNLGTAQICTTVMHLPALKGAGEVRHIAQSVSRIGLDFHPFSDFADTTESAFYLLSNRVTLGITENAAIDNLEAIAKQLVHRERERRGELTPVYVEDGVYRAVALLKSARRLELTELEQLISTLRLGIFIGIINDIPKQLPFALLLNSGENTLCTAFGSVNPDDADYLRADMIRQAFS